MCSAVEELSIMIEKVDELYYRATEPMEKEKLALFHKNLSLRLEDLVKNKLEKSNTKYRKLISRLKLTRKKIDIYQESRRKISDIFKYLSEIIEQVDAVLLGWS